MRPRITSITPKKLIGKHLTMSFSRFNVSELWQCFMPLRKHITNAISSDLISMTIYSQIHFENFSPNNTFEKWAAVEVSDFTNAHEDLAQFTIPGGQYAVFDYKGLSSDNSIFQYIFGEWIPASGYQLDDRPHFEILGEKYKNNDPNSEEEIWIPIKK